MSFASFPYIVIAVAIFIPAVLTIFLPETFGMQMPNNLADAIDLVPERKTNKSQELLPHKLESNNSVSISEDSLQLTKSDEAC